MRQVIIYTDENGEWCASCPSLPGCHSQGESVEAAIANIKEAIEVWIEDAVQHGEPVPEDSHQAEIVLVEV
jgi:predicted RNase H-like HicB family nuclease